MTVLLLRLAAPMQSWGDDSRFARRGTRTAPTKSGVLGMLAAADGRRRTDPIEDLVALRFGVRIDQAGAVESDFQTAIRWRTHDPMPLSTRYYVADAVYVAAVEGGEELIDGLAERVRSPRFPLYLGRRSCPVVGDVLLGVVPGPFDTALREAPWQASGWYRRERCPADVQLQMILDASPGSDGVDVRRDVPISFDPARREYGWRNIELATVKKANPDSRRRSASGMDFLGAAVG